jgi:hypothetical protein
VGCEAGLAQQVARREPSLLLHREAKQRLQNGRRRMPSGGCQHAYGVYTGVGGWPRFHERWGRLECSGRRRHGARWDAREEESAEARTRSGFKLELRLDR